MSIRPNRIIPTLALLAVSVVAVIGVAQANAPQVGSSVPSLSEGVPPTLTYGYLPAGFRTLSRDPNTNGTITEALASITRAEQVAQGVAHYPGLTATIKHTADVALSLYPDTTQGQSSYPTTTIRAGFWPTTLLVKNLGAGWSVVLGSDYVSAQELARVADGLTT